MVTRDYFCMLSEEMLARYKFSFCKNCPFYECELIEEYMQFASAHPRDGELPEGKTITRVSRVTDDDEIRPNYFTTTNFTVTQCESENKKDSIPSAQVNSYRDYRGPLSYGDKKITGRPCNMGIGNVYQIECGRKTVIEGIGDHYKIELTEKLKRDGLSWEKIIKEDTEERWEPLQPVFISAQTGQGKNYFIEKTLIPYVQDLNCREKTNYKILILSNRLALKQQIKKHIDGNDDLDDEGKIYSYGEDADVMTYQSLLYYKKNLTENRNKYIFVICDEAHFFTSDAMFNPHTKKILCEIVRLFHKAIRIYMSATPYECLEYIIKYEDEERERLNNEKYYRNQSKWKGGSMVFYHFKRDYSYLDIKTYSSISEPHEEIVESVVRRKEKWLIFIDDKEKCVREKDKLEKLIRDKESSLVIEDKKSKKKDEKDVETDKENKEENKVEKVFAVDANSKEKSIYQEIVKNERLNKDTYVLISTSVLDNGVNLTGIKNIVVSDMEKSKCLQMVGRARRSNGDERKTLYMKRFCADEVDKRKKNLMRQQEAYHKYELAYDENGNACSPHVYQFFNKYYSGKEADWKDAKHWFGITYEETQWHLNEIAKSLVERLIPQYRHILDEMKEEKDEQQNHESKKKIGQKYLEYQLSWFGKKYCEDDDITYGDKEKSKKEFLAFLEEYAEKGTEIASEEEMNNFSRDFIKLFDAAFYKSDRNNLDYKALKMNRILEKENIKYRIEGKAQVGPWKVVKCN